MVLIIFIAWPTTVVHDSICVQCLEPGNAATYSQVNFNHRAGKVSSSKVNILVSFRMVFALVVDVLVHRMCKELNNKLYE